MRRVLLLLTLLFLSLSAWSAIPLRDELPYREGEKVRYSVLYKWGAVRTEVAHAETSLTAGTAENGQDAYTLDLSCKTELFFDMFYRMREHLWTEISREDGRALFYTRDTLEGDYTAYNHYTYDWDQRMIHADVDYNSRGDEHYEIPFDESVYDLPAFIYFIRRINPQALRPGQVLPIRFVIDDTVFDITLTYKGKENKRVGGMGLLKTHVFDCSVVNGAMFEGNKPVKFWLSEGGSGLPVAFMAPLRVGAMWGVLESVEGLKFPLEPVKK